MDEINFNEDFSYPKTKKKKIILSEEPSPTDLRLRSVLSYFPPRMSYVHKPLIGPIIVQFPSILLNICFRNHCPVGPRVLPPAGRCHALAPTLRGRGGSLCICLCSLLQLMSCLPTVPASPVSSPRRGGVVYIPSLCLVRWSQRRVLLCLLVGLQVVNLWSPFFTAGSRPSFGSSASGPPPPPRRPTASPLVQYSRRGLRPWSVISPPSHKSALIASF